MHQAASNPGPGRHLVPRKLRGGGPKTGIKRSAAGLGSPRPEPSTVTRWNTVSAGQTTGGRSLGDPGSGRPWAAISVTDALVRSNASVAFTLGSVVSGVRNGCWSPTQVVPRAGSDRYSR